MNGLEDLLIDFISEIKSGNIHLYNEYGLQFELAIFLRKQIILQEYKIELERPISHFGIQKNNSITKKEIDIVIYTHDKTSKFAIELKFSNNGQVPLQMYKFCEDIAFLESLVSNGFTKGFTLVLVDRDDFTKQKTKSEGLYNIFRGEMALNGLVICPTGKEKGKELKISGVYKPKWEPLLDNSYYYYLMKIE